MHHACLDGNYASAFSFWDKMFNTFQPELDDVKPVYGTLRPASTWNPVIINFKHIWQISKDAWNTEKFIDKLRIWFMPTGWRPDDVTKKFPLKQIEDPYKQIKYNPATSKKLIVWSWIQYFITTSMMFHLFFIIDTQSALNNYLYAAFLIVNVFSFTSALDKKRYIMIIESVKFIFICLLLYYQNYTWFTLAGIYSYLLFFYFVGSLFIAYYFYNDTVGKKNAFSSNKKIII